MSIKDLNLTLLKMKISTIDVTSKKIVSDDSKKPKLQHGWGITHGGGRPQTFM